MAKKIKEIKNLSNFILLIDTYFKVCEENYNWKKEDIIRKKDLNSYDDLEEGDTCSSIENIVVFPMVSAYLCEIMLKYILFFYKKEFDATHNLTELFNSLHEGVKKEIISKTAKNYPFKVFDEDDFNFLLKYHSNHFEEFRYLFDNLEHGFNEMFLMSFTKALKSTCDEINKSDFES